MSQYFVVHLSNVNSRAEEYLSSASFEWGALGMSEVLKFSQPEGEEDVFVRRSAHRDIDVYFAQAPANGFVESVRSRFPEINLRVLSEENKDWMAEWKKGFKPFALAGGHWVVPSWCASPAEAKHNIWIDPGMAFGTGTHETTQLVAEELVRLRAEDAEFAKAESLLDVGTGTGILAIMAHQMEFSRIAATEIEEDARRVAHENFERNAAMDILLNDTQVQDLPDMYDVVVANIIDGVLVRIQDALKARVKPGGWLIVSGIITEREHDFLSGWKAAWTIRRQKGDWLLFAMKV